MRLYLISSADGKCDAFVRALSSDAAFEHWQQHFKGKYDDVDGYDVQIFECPTDTFATGVIPWDTIVMKEIEL